MSRKILLHVCCGPCSTQAVEVLRDDTLTFFFSNSNIFPEEEYQKRLENAKIVAQKDDIEVIEDEYNHDEWLNFIKGLEEEPEQGRRCEKCFEFRLRRLEKYAKENDYNIVTTTLTVSPFKNTQIINKIGKSTEESQIRFLELNLKDDDGYRNSIKISKELGLYRQKYCGCEFSLNQGPKNIK
jgi:predicted adenine nucleotide alpha hydrolase (AANH) superfamily ATPase